MKTNGNTLNAGRGVVRGGVGVRESGVTKGGNKRGEMGDSNVKEGGGGVGGGGGGGGLYVDRLGKQAGKICRCCGQAGKPADWQRSWFFCSRNIPEELLQRSEACFF